MSHWTSPAPVRPPESCWVTLALVSLRSPSRSAYGVSFQEVTSNSPFNDPVIAILLLRESRIYFPVRQPASNGRCVTTHRLLPSLWRTRGKIVRLGTFGGSLLARPAPCSRGSGGVVRARHRRRSSSPPSCRTRCTETPRRPPAAAPDPVPSPARP